MAVTLAVVAFVVGTAVSLVTSWLLVSRLERVGERLGLSEALLGVVAALAADAPEITAAVEALLRHERAVGAGVVVGSNVFNLAALLGLGAIVAGRIDLHRRVVVLGGVVAIWVAGACQATVSGAVDPGVGLALVLVALVAYLAALSTRGRARRGSSTRGPLATWLAAAVAEEETELESAIAPRRGTARDGAVAAVALVVVVVASIAMERGATTLGQRLSVPPLVVGGLVLAAVTSLPNAVAATYLARRGRGAAALSTALNSNALNVLLGLLVPGVLLGLAAPNGVFSLVAGWYVGMTVLALVLAYADRGLRRAAGWALVVAYAGFVVAVVALT